MSSGTPANGARGADAVLELPSHVLQDVVAAVLRVGDAIGFAATRDGGAVVITMLSDGGQDKLYCGSVDELIEVLDSVLRIAQDA